VIRLPSGPVITPEVVAAAGVSEVNVGVEESIVDGASSAEVNEVKLLSELDGELDRPKLLVSSSMSELEEIVEVMSVVGDVDWPPTRKVVLNDSGTEVVGVSVTESLCVGV
jgi:hypothetical protein